MERQLDFAKKTLRIFKNCLINICEYKRVGENVHQNGKNNGTNKKDSSSKSEGALENCVQLSSPMNVFLP